MSESGAVTLEMIYEEVRSVRRMLEDLVEKAVVNVLPEEEVGDEEWEEIREVESEMERGEYVELEELKRRYMAR